MEGLVFLQKLTNLDEVRAKMVFMLLQESELSLSDFSDYFLKLYAKETYKDSFFCSLKAVRLLKKEALEKTLREGSFRFENIDEMVRVLKDLYEGEDVVNCVDGYYPFIVFAMKGGDFFAKYDPEAKMGGLRRLGSDETLRLLDFLYNNQYRIGFISWEEAKRKLAEINRAEQLELLQAELKNRWEGRNVFSEKHQGNIRIQRLYLVNENKVKIYFEQSGKLCEEVVGIDELNSLLPPRLTAPPKEILTHLERAFKRV